MENCLNCGAELHGKYCSACGQEKITKRASVKSLFHDFLHSSLHWESTLINTVKELIVSPGIFIRKFISGKQKSYTKPVSFYILMLTVYVLLLHFFSENYLTYVTHSIVGDRADTFKMWGLLTITDLQHIISKNVNYFSFILPPMLALFIMLFFRGVKSEAGYKLNYAESLMFSFYVLGTGLLFSSVLMLFGMLKMELWNLRFVIAIPYYIFAIIQFSRSGIGSGIFKSLAAIFLSYLMYVLTIFMMILGYYIIFKK